MINKIIQALLIILFCLNGCQGYAKNPEQEVTALIKDLNSENPKFRTKARNVIPSYGNIAVNPLLAFLIGQKNESIRNDGVLIFIEIKTSEAASALIAFFKQTHDIPNAIQGALIQIGKPSIAPSLTSLNDADQYVRVMCLAALNGIRQNYDSDEQLARDMKNVNLRVFQDDASVIVKETALMSLIPFMDNADVLSVMKASLKSEHPSIREIAAANLKRTKIDKETYQ